MAINIKNLQERIQKKAYAVTSNTPTSELGDIVEAALLATNSLREYDSADLLPTATSTNEKLAYVKKDNSIRFNNGKKWDNLVSGAAQGTRPFVYSGLNGSAQNNGTEYGYVFGGNGNAGHERFSFTSDGNGADVGDLAGSRYWGDAVSSELAGYHFGGEWPSPGYANNIEKMAYASQGDTTDVGDLLSGGLRFSAPAQSATHGYGAGGERPGRTNAIQKWPFATDENSTDAADLTAAHSKATGSSSSTHGYSSGGEPDGDLIQKYAFASDTDATTVGDMTGPAQYAASGGEQNFTHGYIAKDGGPVGESIEKFPFAADANSTDVADISTGISFQTASCNSMTHGYYAGGNSNTIQKYSRAAETDTTDVGDLTVSGYGQAGTSD